MHRLLALFGLLAALCLPLPTWSQDGKIKVSVSHSGNDSVGKQFAYAVREAIRASNGYQLVSADASGLQVNIITIDPERTSSSEGYRTAASICYTMANFLPLQKGNPQTWYPIYLTSQVMTIGSRVEH
jgi:23S rRNA A2030 N6-methylase RlmJ